MQKRIHNHINISITISQPLWYPQDSSNCATILTFYSNWAWLFLCVVLLVRLARERALSVDVVASFQLATTSTLTGSTGFFLLSSKFGTIHVPWYRWLLKK
jgi:hypothetical protein